MDYRVLIYRAIPRALISLSETTSEHVCHELEIFLMYLPWRIKSAVSIVAAGEIMKISMSLEHVGLDTFIFQLAMIHVVNQSLHS